MPVRAIKVWNATTAAWEDLGIAQPDPRNSGAENELAPVPR